MMNTVLLFLLSGAVTAQEPQMSVNVTTCDTPIARAQYDESVRSLKLQSQEMLRNYGKHRAYSEDDHQRILESF